MPVGAELRQSIAKMLESLPSRGPGFLSQHELVQAIAGRKYASAQDAAAAARRLSQGLYLTNSIDDFLDLHRDDKILLKLGKAAIVQSILDFESRARIAREIRDNNNIDFSAHQNTWLTKFVATLGQRGAEQALSNVTFITFNYDRVLELFLHHALMTLYAVEATEAAKIVRAARIFHPYGSVGTLGSGPGNTPFGDRNSQAQYFDKADLIRTYTEEIADQTMGQIISQDVAAAHTLIFLGFAFHEQNMKLLKPGSGIDHRVNIFATAHGISKQDQSVLSGILLDLMHPQWRDRAKVFITEATCSSFMDEFNLTLRRL